MSKTKMKQVDSYIYRKTDKGLKYLMLKRKTGKHYEHLWQGVAGKIEKGETAWQAVVRELLEETGKTPKKFFVADHIASFYNAKFDKIMLVPLFGIEVDDDKVILSDEHCDYKWVSFDEALNLLTWKGQKKGLEAVNSEAENENGRARWSEIKLK